MFVSVYKKRIVVNTLSLARNIADDRSCRINVERAKGWQRAFRTSHRISSYSSEYKCTVNGVTDKY